MIRYLLGIAFGLTVGLPQGLGKPMVFFKVDILPHNTVYTVIAFGFFGGILLGTGLVGKIKPPFDFIAKYIDLYSFFLVCMLAIGIPIIYKVGLSNIFVSALFNGLVFTMIGLGILTAGLVKFLLNHKKA